MEVSELPWGLILTLVLLLATYAIGSALERSHYRSIKDREAKHRGFPAVTFENLPKGWVVETSNLVQGSVVISVDYFKRFLAGLKLFFGGRITSYEPLLDRARREALLRMVEEATAQGYDAVINVRIETSRLASSARNGKGTSGVEMLAFGTALKLAPPDLGQTGTPKT